MRGSRKDLSGEQLTLVCGLGYNTKSADAMLIWFRLIFEPVQAMKVRSWERGKNFRNEGSLHSPKAKGYHKPCTVTAAPLNLRGGPDLFGTVNNNSL